jgi:CRP-like cAMP-binding protein
MARVTAVSSTTLRVIPKDEMLRLLRSDRHFSEYFINLMLARNIRATQQVVDLLCDDTEKRLIRALLFLAQFSVKNENDEVTLSGVSQELLGEMIGTSRTHVNGAMRRLKRMGFVEYNEGLRIHPTPLLSLL